jgi:tRNA-dihydrouridine synthase
MLMFLSEMSDEEDPITPTNKRTCTRQKRRFEWWRDDLKNPKHVVAPMVDLSEHAFRMMTRSYGADLCYTPMMHAKNFAESAQYRKYNFFTSPDDQPLIAQFCGDDGDTIVKAAKFIEDQVSGVDLNLGCPQGIAKKGHYGSYLLMEPDLVIDIATRMVQGLSCPVTCKIRLINTGEQGLQDTMNLVQRLDAAGIDALCVHGRTKEMKGQQTGPADWDAIMKIKERFATDFPIILNGGIETYDDVQAALKHTNVNAVMSSESILETPCLFSGNNFKSQDEFASEYLQFAEKYPHKGPVETRCIKTHMFRFLYAGLQRHTDLRESLARAKNLDEIKQVVNTMRERRLSEKEGSFPDRGWYRRYREPIK